MVAGEVGNLAQRSAHAAKEIKDLIGDSVTKAAEGTWQVAYTGQTMSKIVTSVQRVVDRIGEIAAATIEQSQGISQFNHAVTMMGEATNRMRLWLNKRQRQAW